MADHKRGNLWGDSKKAYQLVKTLTKTSTQVLAIKDSSDYLLTQSAAVLNWWTEYCKDLYNFQQRTDTKATRLQLERLQTTERSLESWFEGWPDVDIPDELPSRLGKKQQRFLLLFANKSRNASGDCSKYLTWNTKPKTLYREWQQVS